MENEWDSEDVAAHLAHKRWEPDTDHMRLLDILLDYGGHKKSCQPNKTWDNRCTCGWGMTKAWLKQLRDKQVED